MKLPDVRYSDRSRKSTQVKFGGLNHTVGAGDGEIWDMKNMTGDYYPLLATRERRYKILKLEQPGGIYAWEKLCWVDDTGFYYDGVRKGGVSAGSKRFASMGAYIVILPDKCFYNVETDTFGSMESYWSGGELTFTNGKLYDEEAEANTIYCKGVTWSNYFRAGDAVTISGCTAHPENNKTAVIRAIDGDKLYFYEYVFKLDGEGGYTEEGELSLSRTVPDLEYICENENRLWGCTGSTIYASKLNDIFNWNVYDGLESDAWAVEPTAAGVLTGSVSYKGYSIFFKEGKIYKVYGSTPSNYSIVSSASIGVADGSGGSLAIAGETLFYLSRSGIMAYSGGIPQPISQAFGTEHYRNAVAGSNGLKYFVSMQDGDGEWGLFVFDTQTGLWHKEDQTQVTHFANCDGNLYMLNAAGEVWTVGRPNHIPDGAELEAAFDWMVEFADFTEEDPNKKSAGKMQLRMELEDDAVAAIDIQFDSDGNWRRVREIYDDEVKRSWCLPIIPRRCDYYRLRITGTGGCRIYSLAREYSQSSELKSKHGRN